MLQRASCGGLSASCFAGKTQKIATCLCVAGKSPIARPAVPVASEPPAVSDMRARLKIVVDALAGTSESMADMQADLMQAVA